MIQFIQANKATRRPIVLTFIVHLLFLGLISANPKVKPKEKVSIIELACNDWINLSLDTFCQATVTLDMLLESKVSDPSDYSIQLWDGNILLTGLNFNAKDHNKLYTFKVIHLPSGNSCWGKIYVEDKLAPALDCNSDTLRCAQDYSVNALGLPIPSYITGVTIKPDPKIPNTYELENWDACSPVTATYRDEVQEFYCDSMFCKVILRYWTVVDVAGNKSECADTIFIKKSDFTDVVIPSDFDGDANPIIKCYDNYPKLPNGNPSPIYTGHPVPSGCDKLIATYDDLKINICPNSYKILRRWIVLDWCSKRIQEINQIIKIIDDKGPEFNVPSEVNVGMQSYTCGSYGKLPIPENVVDCGTWTYNIYTQQKDNLGNILPETTQFIIWNSSENCYYIHGAPKGKIIVIYELSDACGNATRQQIVVKVEDNLIPTPICDEKTVVTLGTDGRARVFAKTFDNGSIDNCEIAELKVRRMSDRCILGSEEFRDYVDFCCDDVGDSIQIILKVIDASRNENTCMVRILVQEKEVPEIIAPTNITISCSMDRSNLSNFGLVRLSESERKNIIIRDVDYYSGPNFIAGRDGLATDNCYVILTEIIDSTIKCNQGFIRRTFIATDRQGLSNSATQIITIGNPRPFNSSDIVFPSNITINSCRAANIDPSIIGAPGYRNIGCAQVASTYEDKLLSKVDSSCYRIIRRWTVLDWCQYNVQTNAGYWEAVQVIDIINSDPPNLYSCNDLEICDYSSYYDPVRNACIGTFSLTGEGDDDCTKDPFLIWKYRLDINNDGIFETSGLGKRVTGTVPIGMFRVEWILEDQCGNISRCIQKVSIKDCKKPTPYCHNGIVTVIMPLNAQIAIWAKDFNINSSDNCTQPENLKYSFSEDTTHTSILYNCDSMQRQSRIIKNVRMYVTDESGNQDYCDVQVILQDNNNVCGGTVVSIKGSVNRSNNEPMRQVNLAIKNSTQQILKQSKTDDQGKYAFEEIALSPELYIEASLDGEPLEGVTTYDIVLIQKNILGKQVFVSPYQYLAADVNNSGSVTSKDISDLRKLILEVKAELPCKTIWNFVPESNIFEDTSNPWGEKKFIELKELLQNPGAANFIAYKKGDVDNSASIGLSNIKQRTSSLHWTIGEAILMNTDYLYPVTANQFMSLEGFQTSLKSKDIMEIVSAALEIESGNYSINNGVLNLSWSSGQAININPKEILFYIKSTKQNNQFTLLEKSWNSEAYLKDGNYSLIFQRSKQSAIINTFVLGQNIPNPYYDKTVIPVEVSESCSMTLYIHDLTGKLVYSKPVVFEKGINYIPVDMTMISNKGIYLYKLEGVLGTEIKKMIVK